jgi:hypothetical protein
MKNTYDADVYVTFRVPVQGVEGDTPVSAAEKARAEVIEILSDVGEVNACGVLMHFEEAPDVGVDFFAGDDDISDPETVYIGRRADLRKQAVELAQNLKNYLLSPAAVPASRLQDVISFLEKL